MLARLSWLPQVFISEDTSVVKTLAQKLFGGWSRINPALPNRGERHPPKGPPASWRQGARNGAKRGEAVRRGGGSKETTEHSSELILVISSQALLPFQIPSDSRWKSDHITSLFKTF